jgi:hypothetical protein
MSIGAIGGVSGNRQPHINMATYEIYFSDVPSQPQPLPQNPSAAMTAMLRQVLLQVAQPGGGSLGQGGGQRGGHQGGCYGSSADAAHGSDGAGATQAPVESQGVEDSLDGANGLVDAISGLLAAIAPLLSAMGGGGGGSGGGALSTTDDASHLAGLLSASGF